MLVSLRARGFRNLVGLEFSPGAGSHLLLGDNGAGKTSLLEAVYVVATTRSFRTPRVEECVRHGAEGFHLAAEVEGRARWRLEVGWEGGDRSRAVNGNATSAAEHLEVLPVVAATAADGEVLTGAPALRRRFLDRGVVGTRPGALEALGRYRRTLQNKRDLLAQEGGARRAVDPAELDTWNTLLATAAAEVIALRHTYARRLSARLAELRQCTELPFPEVALHYQPSPAVELPGAAAWPQPGQPHQSDPPPQPEQSHQPDPSQRPDPADQAGQVEQGDRLDQPPDRSTLAAEILERLRQAAGDEVRRGQPLLGPHRDDLEILWGSHPVKATVSAGERKALSLLLTAAHGRALAAADREPLYLLDDLDAELSAATLGRVWRVFAEARQVLVTSNRPSVWKRLELDHRSRLEDGRLEV